MSAPEATAGGPKPRLPRLENWSPMVHAEGVFTPQECLRIVGLAETLKPAEVQSAVGVGRYRDSDVCFLRPGPDTNWVFERTMGFVEHANRSSFQLELAGFTEPLQVAEYGPGQYYDWHLDFGNGRLSIRKLSFIVQLTDPADYQGGGIDLYCAREPLTAPRGQGTMIAFPAYMLHRVRAVTEGRRRSLVGWIGGPPFR
ncbi:MAG: 2OG-Fe(II) oxygenase [Pseudomonadota bacterium]